MPDDIDVADVLRVKVTGGDVRVNIGEKSDGEGFGADTALWSSGPAFISVPNVPSTAGCTQVLTMQDGNYKRAFASRDLRFAGNAGTLVTGDAAIVTDGDVWVLFKQATGVITLHSGDMEVTVSPTDGIRLVASPGPAPTLSLHLDPITGTCRIKAPFGLYVNDVPVTVP